MGLKIRSLKPKIIELILSMALDHKSTHREMSSVLISDLYGKVLTSDDIASGFDDVLKSLNDLTIDAPDAPMVTTYFNLLKTFSLFFFKKIYVNMKRHNSSWKNILYIMQLNFVWYLEVNGIVILSQPSLENIYTRIVGYHFIFVFNYSFKNS